MRTPKILRFLGGMIGIISLIFMVVEYFTTGVVQPDHITYATVGFAFTGLGEPAFNTVEPDDGEENMGGYGQVAYLALRSHIAGYPTIPLPTTPTTMEELVDLQGDYSFITDRHFIKIFVAPNSLFVDPESQGEYPGAKSFLNKGGFTIPGLKSKQRGLARILNNSYGIIVIPDEDGTRTSFGTELRPVHFVPKGKSGKKAADAKGMDYEFSTDSFVPGYNYKGVIVLDGSTLPAVS